MYFKSASLLLASGLALSGCAVSSLGEAAEDPHTSAAQAQSTADASESSASGTDSTAGASESSASVTESTAGASDSSAPVTESTAAQTSGEYLEDYSLEDMEYGTSTTVVVDSTVRTIVTNSLPNHETGSFPNSGNPNTITGQSNTWVFPASITYLGEPSPVRETGVGLNGVKFEPGTAEVAVCATGESYSIEGLQDVADLGMDFNNAHVQPNGEYHYHGISALMVEIFESESDLVHVGFAQDGALIYYSKSGQYSSGYKLGEEPRDGTDCSYSGGNRATIVFGAEKDGSLTSDWDYSASHGDLDVCNGIEIDGIYSYLITDEFPYIPRCLMGEFSETGPGGDRPQRGQG
jgi:hypothetical protein